MQQKQILYFAYGSNLSKTQMLNRCPTSSIVGVAKLDGWKFQYDGVCDDWSDMAVGNIIQSTGNRVIGVVYALTDKDTLSMDKYEDYPVDYEKKVVTVSLNDEQIINAFVYTRYVIEKVGEPSRAYENTIISGAREYGLPEDYIREYFIFHDDLENNEYDVGNSLPELAKV